ncbi:ABC transporter ATP-binding protein [Desulfothermus naphthae]
MLLEIRNLSKTFKRGWLKKRKLCVIANASLCLHQGETIGIVGDNGSGKTTLALMLVGLLKPDKGQILFKGKDITYLSSWERKEYRRQVQIVFQHPETAFNPKWKLWKSMREPFYLHKIPYSEEEVLQQLKRVGLRSNILSRYPAQLSGGEIQRAAIARVMSLNPAVVILDEPTSMLDAITQAQIIRLLEEIQQQQRVSYLFISHDLELVKVFCKKIYELKEGVLKEDVVI